MPNNVTIKVGEEILVLNDDTDFQSLTNGIGPDDSLSGKLFDSGPIPTKGFVEYIASTPSNNYPIYWINTTSAKGVLIMESNSN
jgi:hypothetical protein